MAVAALIHSEEEAEGLIRWSLLFALAEKDERVVVLHHPSISEEKIQSIFAEWETNHPGVPELVITSLESPEPDLRSILDLVGKASISLLVLGQNRRGPVTEETLQLNRKIFDHAVCDAVMIRLGKRKLEECDSVLVPSAGGPHSLIALRLGSKVASRFDGKITPLFVEPEIGEEDGKAVGLRVLNRVLKEAGVDADDEEHVQAKVVVANNVGKGIARAAAEGSFDLILIGASNSFSVKRKLFGEVPPSLLDGDNAITVAVLRRRKPVTHRVRASLERFLTLRIPQLEREHRITLFDRLQTQSQWNFDFMTLMLLSTSIASFGLLQNSVAVVIGAMLVAPLMTPLLGSGLALVQGNLPLMRSCLKAIFFGFFAALILGVLMGFIAPGDQLTSELAGRGKPNLLDFGVAAASGIAASHCIARPGLSSALAGVAIAAALVPPIATVGISLALGEWINSRGAALLFGTNVVAIILSSSFTFFLMGIRAHTGTGRVWARRTVVFLLIVLAILMVPLGTVLLSKAGSRVADTSLVRDSLLIDLVKRDAEEFELTVGDIRLLSSRVVGKRGTIVLEIEGNEEPPSGFADRIADQMKEEFGLEEVKVKIRFVPVLISQ